MADKKIAIQSLKLKLGSNEVEITVEQARELKALLDDLLGKEVIKVIEDKWWYMPNVVYPVPQWTYIKSTPDIVGPVVTWGTTNNAQFKGETNQLCLSVGG